MSEKMMVDRYEFFDKLSKEGHILVAGTNGSGKSVVLRGIIITAIMDGAQLMILDPKGGVEFGVMRDTADCIAYGEDVDEFRPALLRAVNIMDERLARMKPRHERKCSEKPLYIIADEYGDMMTEKRKDLQPLLLKLARKGRAANVRLVLATQTPYKSIVTGDIKANLLTTVALKTRSKSDSRIIIDEGGAELLNVGEALVKYKDKFDVVKEHVPYYSEELFDEIAYLRTPPSKRWK